MELKVKKNVIRTKEERELDAKRNPIPRIKTREEMHHEYSGSLGIYDFLLQPVYSSPTSGSYIARKIRKDQSFDYSCSKADGRKHENGNWKVEKSEEN